MVKSFVHTICALITLLALTAPARADWVNATVPVGTNPYGVAINPVTNKIYVANQNTDNVTVIDGATNNTATVAVGDGPYFVAINPVTNKIYVTNRNSSTVTVIDGATNDSSSVAVGTDPQGLAVNPVTNKIYVANYGSNSVTVIDGVDNTIDTTVDAGTGPVLAAVNPVTNKIYVTNLGSNDVTVIDGVTNITTTVAVGFLPIAVAVNPVTNKIYVGNNNSANVTVINGTDNSTTVVSAGSFPRGVAVNPATNKIYIVNDASANVTVIDGITNTVSATVAVGSSPSIFVAVNPVTNKIYVANYGSNSVTVIDGATNTKTTVAAGTNPWGVALNPVTNKIYVGNQNSNTVTVIDGSSNNTATVAAGTTPYTVAVNPVTNKIYVANIGSNNVTVIDGNTNDTTTVAAGTASWSVAVNPVTNNIYATNYGSANVTVIDGATNTVSATVSAGINPVAVAVNPVTNKIYVANYGSNTVTVIDGATNGTATVGAGSDPYAMAVNPATNRIYVANRSSNNVTVIDGATNVTATVAAGTYPQAVAVNPVTNKIYVANGSSNNVTVIDGATNAKITVGAGSNPYAVAVNPVTNKIYVSNASSGNVTVIDGATDSTTTTVAGASPRAVAVNPVTNKIYVANASSDNLTVIDGATNSTTTVTAGASPQAVAVNPVTNKIYGANWNSANVTVIDEAPVYDTGVRVVIDSLSGNVTYQTQPVLTGKGVNRWSPSKTNMMGVINDFPDIHHAWNWSAGPFDSTSSDSISWTYNWGTDSLRYGENYINIVPLEMQAGTTNNLGLGTPMVGNMLTYPVYYLDNVPPSQVNLISPANDTMSDDGSFIFAWNSATDNYGMGLYHLQVAANDSFAPCYLDTLVSDTFLAITLSPADTIYYWQVQAVDICGNEGSFSLTWQLEIDVLSPATPALLTPADNSWLASDTAFCIWGAVSKTGKASAVYYVLKAYNLADTTNPVIVDTTAMTTDTLLISEGRFRWQVEAYDEAGNPPGISGFFNFGYDTTSPAVASLLTPADSLITNQSNIGFAWNVCTDSVSGLKEYTLQYAYDPSFSVGLAETTLTDTSITLVMADSNYYWRVVASDTAGNISMSIVRYLSIDTYDPAIPALLSPIDDYWTEDSTIICSWGEVVKMAKAADVSYVIQLDTTNTFTSPIIEDTTAILSDAFNLSEGQYYWRVMAFDLAGNYGTYSDYRTFGIDTTAPDIQYVTILSDDPSVPYGPYEVVSSVYDLSGVKSAWMFTQINGESWDSTAMFFASDSLRDSIPEQTVATDETLTVSYYIKAIDMLDHQSISSTYSFKAIGPLGVTGNPGISLPAVYALTGAYPNPSRGSTTFKYQLPEETKVKLEIYNVAGQLIKTFDQGTKPAGYHQINWNDSRAAAGVYFYRLRAGSFMASGKLILLR